MLLNFFKKFKKGKRGKPIIQKKSPSRTSRFSLRFCAKKDSCMTAGHGGSSCRSRAFICPEVGTASATRQQPTPMLTIACAIPRELMHSSCIVTLIIQGKGGCVLVCAAIVAARAAPFAMCFGEQTPMIGWKPSSLHCLLSE